MGQRQPVRRRNHPVQVIDTERQGAQEVYNLRALPNADE